jgi:hypothetical protein
MDTIAYDRRDPELDQDGSEFQDQPLPRRPRRNFFNRRSAALVALLTCAAGFYAGVRVEKGQIASTPVTLGASGSAATGSGARAGATGAAGGSRASGASGASGTSGAASRTASAGGASGAGGFAARFGAAGGAAGANTSLGTVSTVNGKTLVVTEASGNTVKVNLSSAKITKSQSVGRSAIHPGDTVVIEGVPSSSGTVVAATVSDSGAGRAAAGFGGAASGSGASGAGASSSGSGSSSAVGSLFSGGGSGG